MNILSSAVSVFFQDPYFEFFLIKDNMKIPATNYFVTNIMTNIKTIEEIAEFFKLTPRTVYNLARAGKIPGFKVGHTWRFDQNIIEEWYKERILNLSMK